MFRSLLLGLIVAGIIFVIDQYTKWLAIHYIFTDTPDTATFIGWLGAADIFLPQTVVEMTSFFNLVMVWNHGVSFGIMNIGTDDYAMVLIALSLVICFVLCLWLWNSATFVSSILLGAIIGGALGNSFDRLRFGAVVDFLDFHVYNYHWPAFNMADTAITVSVVILILMQLFGENDTNE